MERTDGVRFIARHIAGTRDLEWLYALYPKVVVPARWGWQKLVRQICKANIAGAFFAAYKKALRTEK